jgi:hypothetical protein
MWKHNHSGRFTPIAGNYRRLNDPQKFSERKETPTLHREQNLDHPENIDRPGID